MMKKMLMLIVLIVGFTYSMDGGSFSISSEVSNDVGFKIEPSNKVIVINVITNNGDTFNVKTVRKSGSEYRITTDVKTNYNKSVVEYFKNYTELKEHIFNTPEDTVIFTITFSPLIFKQHDVSKRGQKFAVFAGGSGTLAYECRLTGDVTISFMYNGKSISKVIPLTGSSTVESSINTNTTTNKTPTQQLNDNMEYMFESGYEKILIYIEKVVKQM